MNKAIFLDRDGTINKEKGYLYRADQFEFLPGVVDALRTAQFNNYKLIVITNQSGIARGYYSEEDFEALNTWMLKSLSEQGVVLDAVYYCPHHPKAIIQKYKINCICRKPMLGLYARAIADFNLDLNLCFAIGDKMRDCSICQVTACHGFLIGNNEEEALIDDVKAGKIRNIEYVADLPKAVDRIILYSNNTYNCII